MGGHAKKEPTFFLHSVQREGTLEWKMQLAFDLKLLNCDILKSRNSLLEGFFNAYRSSTPQSHLFECTLSMQTLFIYCSVLSLCKKLEESFQTTYFPCSYTHKFDSMRANQYGLKSQTRRGHVNYCYTVVFPCKQLTIKSKAMIKTKWNSIGNCLHIIVFTMAK